MKWVAVLVFVALVGQWAVRRVPRRAPAPAAPPAEELRREAAPPGRWGIYRVPDPGELAAAGVVVRELPGELFWVRFPGTGVHESNPVRERLVAPNGQTFFAHPDLSDREQPWEIRAAEPARRPPDESGVSRIPEGGQAAI
ncbi:MAG: hypothetical protein IT372_07890 [Polyangiaceae bacterium]|nr:hypothetical protein [Polyangiaceae bacterium]